MLPIDIHRARFSRLWRGLATVWSNLMEYISWNIHDGQDTDFWYDQWLESKGHLVFKCTSDFSSHPRSVSEMVTESDYWNWELFSSILPDEVVQQIATVQPPLAQLEPDTIGWRWEMNRCFSTKSAYAALNRGYVRILLESDNKEVVCALCYTDRIVPSAKSRNPIGGTKFIMSSSGVIPLLHLDALRIA
ncbi:hypothetical protein V6N12_044310 [Hibiscus sabdariffa]|uniref:Uncharacterized protein n=1 Tax=Hibiscus sabdariffa TaxID=183260 RepID=A0ABR2DGW9_9ROSI